MDLYNCHMLAGKKSSFRTYICHAKRSRVSMSAGGKSATYPGGTVLPFVYCPREWVPVPVCVCVCVCVCVALLSSIHALSLSLSLSDVTERPRFVPRRFAPHQEKYLSHMDRLCTQSTELWLMCTWQLCCTKCFFGFLCFENWGILLCRLKKSYAELRQESSNVKM